MLRLIELKKRFPFSLVVEDPQARWSEDPRRYEAIAARYSELLGQDFLLDLNILPFRLREKPTLFPTLVQTGTEALSLVAVAAGQVDRVLVYAESSVNPQDFPLLAFAAGSGARMERLEDGFKLSSSHPVTLDLGAEHRLIAVDGDLHSGSGDGRFLLPAGAHTVRTEGVESNMFSNGLLHASLLSITGDLLYEKEDERGVYFGYDSTPRCLVSLNKHPVAVTVDGTEVPLQVLKGSGRYSVLLPCGHHDVHITTKSTLSHGVDVTSLWSSSLIVVFGCIAVALLTLFYFTVRIFGRTQQGSIR
jgi:hypothetical protein